MRDQTADTRRGTTPADPGTNLTAATLTDADRAALYPTVPADPPAVDLIDRHLLAAADYHAPPATRRDDARALYAALAADAAPYDAGDAPVGTVTPLPIRDDPARLRQQLDKARGLVDHVGDQLTHARATIASQAEQLRRNGTLLCRLRDLDEQRDRAWAEHDTIGDTVIPDNPTALRAAARHLRLLADDHQADSLGFGIAWAANTLDAWADTPDDLTEDDVDALARAIEKADTARIDTRHVVWHPTTEGWSHPVYGTLTLAQLEEQYGPTRAVLLVDIDADDSDMGDPPADWRINLADDQGATLGSPPARAQGLDDLSARLAAALAESIGNLTPDGGGCTRGWIPARTVERWKRLLAEHADRSLAAGWQREADRLDQAAVEPAHDHTGGGLPLFAPDATVHVNSIDGPEVWTGAQWNDHARAAWQHGRAVPERMVLCPRSVCTTTCPVDQANTEG